MSKEMVNHPSHYNKNGMEVIDVIDAFTSDLYGRVAFDTQNCIKYILRWKSKNGVEDLKKCKWYLEDLISQVDEQEDKNLYFQAIANFVLSRDDLDEYGVMVAVDYAISYSGIESVLIFDKDWTFVMYDFARALYYFLDEDGRRVYILFDSNKINIDSLVHYVNEGAIIGGNYDEV